MFMNKPDNGGDVHDEHLVVGVDLEGSHEAGIGHVRQEVEDILQLFIVK